MTPTISPAWMRSDDEPIDDEAAAIILDQWLNKVPGENNENH